MQYSVVDRLVYGQDA